jgi:hypothetical protein
MMGMPSCREAAERLSREQDQPGPRSRSMALRLHLLICGHCRRYARQLQWLRASLQRVLTDASDTQLSASARDRIRARLAREQALQQ